MVQVFLQSLYYHGGSFAECTEKQEKGENFKTAEKCSLGGIIEKKKGIPKLQ